MNFNPEPLVRSIWPDIEYVNSIDYSVDESRADKFFYHVVSKCWLDLPEVILRPNGSSVVIPTSYPIQLQHVQGAKTQRHGRSISESSFSSEHTSHSKPASI